MRTYEEVAYSVISRGKARLAVRRRRKKQLLLSAVIVVLLSVAGGFSARFLRPDLRLVTGVSEPSATVTALPPAQGETDPSFILGSTVTETQTYPVPVTEVTKTRASSIGGTAQSSVTAASSVPTQTGDLIMKFIRPAPSATVPATSAATEAMPEVPDDGVYSGGAPEIASLPRQIEITYEGERISSAEAEAYFKENLPWIASALSASGTAADLLTVAPKGYCHLNVGDTCVVRQNFMDFLLYNEKQLVSIVTLYKEDGRLYSTPAFGAPWFDRFDSFLQAHRGEELLFVYAGNLELIVTPENEVFSPLGVSVGFPLDYSALYCREIVYVP